MKTRIFVLILLIAASTIAWAQRGRWWRGSRGTSDRRGVPSWEVDPEFPADVFTFVRVRYDSGGGWGRRGGGWMTDYPDSDLNFPLRLQQLTSMKVSPDPIIRRLTDPDLCDYPFLYLIEPGAMRLSDAEAAALRTYCLRGGFLMVDDFWGVAEYANLAAQMEKVFPDREPAELPIEHEIFHCVYDLKEKPQVPALNRAYRGSGGGYRTWENAWDGSDTRTPHYKAITDDDNRIMVLICHNTDLGDGWEREGEQRWYFEEFSLKRAYPMGINIVTYAMTH